MTVYLSDEEIELLLTPEAALEAVRIALRDVGLGRAQNRERVWIDHDGGFLRSLMGVVPALDAAGLKQGFSRVDVPASRMDLVSLYSVREGRLLAIVQSSRINELRTAAAAAIAAEHLAREDSETVGVIGTGPHAVAQVELLRLVAPVTRVLVFSRTLENRLRFVEALRRRTSLEAEPTACVADAVREADIVVEATSSRVPVLTGDMISKGTHVSSIGSSLAGRQVLADSLLGRVDRFVVDDKEQALHDGSGDVLGALLRGFASYASLVALGALVAGVQAGRTQADEITLYKSLGMGVLDVAAAHAAWTVASERGAGTMLGPAPG